MFEFRVELDGPVRATAHAELAIEAAAQIVLVAGQHLFLLALFVGHRLGHHPDRTVGAVHLTDAAGHALVLVVLVVGHDQLPAETVEHLQRVPVFGILFGGFLAEENPNRHLHPLEQRQQPGEKGGHIFLKSIHIQSLLRLNPIR